MKVALLISTYNRPDALEVVLDSVSRQTRLPDEVIIADDGSRDNTREVIDRLRETTLKGITVKHVWQEDNGYRLTKIRNKAIAATTCDYLIQIDGDAMLHPRFVEDHARLARPGYFIKGVRSHLNKELTEEICASRKSRVVSWLDKRYEEKRINALKNPLLSLLMNGYRRRRNDMMGCNCSFWVDDLYMINGYDETIEGYSPEDRDLSGRLMRSGIKKQELRFGGIQYHLWHPELSRARFAENDRYIKEQARKQINRAPLGLDQYERAKH